MDGTETPAEDPNESAWSEETVEGQLNELEEDEAGGGEEEDEDD